MGDLTRTARARAQLKRLDEAQGKRLVVDLDAAGRAALERLHEGGYGESQRAVVIKALLFAEKEFGKKPL